MPKKIREIKSILLQAGFSYEPAKGSHSKWMHPKLLKSIILSGKDGDDAKLYLERQVNKALAELNKLEQEEEEEKEKEKEKEQQQEEEN
jgi:predicted RNA binding protein YcfA (HicA-like mRNA interferase family)